MSERVAEKGKPRTLRPSLEEYLETKVVAKSKARAAKTWSTQKFPRKRTSGNAQSRTTFHRALIGFERERHRGRAGDVVLAAGPQHANPMGTLHGGVLCDIADAAMGIALQVSRPRMNPLPPWN